MLKLVLNVEDSIRGDMVKDGIVDWLMGTDVPAKGTFKLFDAGTGINAALTLKTEVAVEKNIVVNNAAATANLANLTGTVVHRVTFSAGSNVPIVTDIPCTDTYATSTFNGVTVEKYEVETDVYHIKLTRTGNFTTPATIDVEIPNIKVATGHLVDPNINSGAASTADLKVLAVGNLHIDAVCQWRRHEGLKPNETHFNMRADDPHTKVLALVPVAHTTET